ncbi:cytochrome P450 family protein [Saccharothrix syringae]|uniref:Cytochrome P450 n=1 Tax=Saccharothrix syringae TaxID=103733 RepID=A0A5Q0H8M7_SACSY|nr:cytochrome P450 [Saccharothrix syringae]QFZ22561.1 cytochrome P450 [Saccharothrix syringae]
MGEKIAGLDVIGDEYYADPHAYHARLREQEPVKQIVLPRGTKAWMVTRYEEGRQVLADPRFAKNFERFPDLMERNHVGDAERNEFDQSLVQHMLNMDPPDHTRLRKLVTKAFTARRVEQLRPRVQEITDELLDRVADGGEVDLIEALAFPLPITVICEMLDVPLDERDDFRKWSNTLVVGGANVERIQEAGMSMAAYLSRLVEHKRANPGDDFFSALVHTSEDGDALNHTELISMAFLLLVAGHETTVNLIASGVYSLLRHPDQLEKLRADRSLLPGAVEEFLRYEGPINQATFRFTTEDVPLGDVVIPKDSLVLVSLLSGNRDEDKFPDADRFDITRPAGGHLAFGHGIHYCLGAPLARLEGEIAVGTLLDRFDVELAAEPETLRWRESTLVHGLHSLPISLKPRGTAAS